MSQVTNTVAVLMGGQSTEHDVSLKSGANVLRALEGSPYSPVGVVIDRGGLWHWGDETRPLRLLEALARLEDEGVCCVFIALHGPFGEDGRIQALLDCLGIPYTGSGYAASALAMDKIRCKAVVQSQGIRVAAHLALDRRTWQYDGEPVLRAIQEDVGLPCVIKPSRQGSSFGISVIRDYRELAAALDAALALDEEVYAEEYIEGREVTCGVLDVDPEGRLRALEVTEIRPKTAAFFDFEAKYTPGASEEITPAPLDTDTTNEVKQMAVDVHEIVGCSGWSRSDFIIGEEGPVWLEVNTVPGLTETSLYPQAARAAGIPFNQLVLMFIEHALRRHAQERQRG